MEKMVSPAEEKQEVEEEIETAEEEGEDDDEEGTEEEEEHEDVEEKETIPQAPDTTEKNISFPVKSKEKQQANDLNLNNEVVKMRKEVKRVRALTIRKLTRHIGALKKKKGKETDIEKNQRRAARLREEIHAMKALSPDLVTKTALQKNLNFEQMCKNPKSTISDRAIARIATHPQFNKKIKDIKAAVKAFKEERIKGGKEGGKEKVQNQAGKVTSQSPEQREERKHEKEKEENKVKHTEVAENTEGDDILKDVKKATHSASTAVQEKDMPVSKSEKPVSESEEVKDNVKDKPQSKEREKKPNLRPLPAVLQKTTDSGESELESSDDEEKQYFDDSTEERFHKKSSQSEESEDDDFFVGKVSKFKKKNKQKSIEEKERSENTHKSKATSFQSVFCSSLSGSKHTWGGSGGGGAGSGRSGDKFRGQWKLQGVSGNRDFNEQSKFQKQTKGTERSSASSYSKPCPESEEKGFTSVGKGRGRGRGDVMRLQDNRGKGVFSHQAPEQALHPSWEASRKRKEQQGQILAFQGKKIKFDDD
ncbi:serum response factor-binding protein 1 [Mastacembelus armatus]|uniref:Serum response factor-binding protein 1 n=1 Tax=Mastacembelus armatus TaxID=205130 RepID=A0A3Q3LBC8_9TELE|nr:serum response factor-binding protein 1 [Mastacembelus armatus]